MFLVPFKNGWTDSAKLFFAGSVGVRRKFFGGKKPNSASGFAGKTGKLRFLEYYLTNWAKIFRQGACGPEDENFFSIFFGITGKTGKNRQKPDNPNSQEHRHVIYHFSCWDHGDVNFDTCFGKLWIFFLNWRIFCKNFKFLAFSRFLRHFWTF